MKLSIIMPIYNTAKYLPYTLKSLTSQNYADVEFVCVDDCSTDDSWRILCETAKLDKRFRLIRQEYNQGVGAARKKAVDASLGKYIMFLDGDDALAENACERLVEEIERQHVDILQFELKRYIWIKVWKIQMALLRSTLFRKTLCWKGTTLSMLALSSTKCL